MRAMTLSCLLAVAGALTLPVDAESAEGSRCELPAGADPFADRARLLTRFEQLPPACLRSLFVQCNAAASQGLLDFSSAAACSFGYEALLRRDFGGNFPALMAWWDGERRTRRPE